MVGGGSVALNLRFDGCAKMSRDARASPKEQRKQNCAVLGTATQLQLPSKAIALIVTRLVQVLHALGFAMHTGAVVKPRGVMNSFTRLDNMIDTRQFLQSCPLYPPIPERPQDRSHGSNAWPN
jgi:hypothetical protein